jgi:hypothetical protein
MSQNVVRLKTKDKSTFKLFIQYVFRNYGNKVGMRLEDLLMFMWYEKTFPKELLNREELSSIYSEFKEDCDKLTDSLCKFEKFKEPSQKAFVATILVLTELSLGYGIFPSDYGFSSFFDSQENVDFT